MASEKSKLSANIAARVDLIGGREQAHRAWHKAAVYKERKCMDQVHHVEQLYAILRFTFYTQRAPIRVTRCKKSPQITTSLPTSLDTANCTSKCFSHRAGFKSDEFSNRHGWENKRHLTSPQTTQKQFLQTFRLPQRPHMHPIHWGVPKLSLDVL